MRFWTFWKSRRCSSAKADAVDPRRLDRCSTERFTFEGPPSHGEHAGTFTLIAFENMLENGGNFGLVQLRRVSSGETPVFGNRSSKEFRTFPSE